MSFLQHLEVLRWHLVRSIVAIAVGAILCFSFKEVLFDSILFAPKSPSFITFKALCKLSVQLHQWMPQLIAADAICIGQNIPPLQNISMSGQFLAHLTVSIVAGIVLAIPYVFWELWRFIRPALNAGEEQRARGSVVALSLLFLLGACFGYYLIVPLSINFLATYQVSEHVSTLPTLSSYVSTVTTIVLACGGIFELPLLVRFLSRMGWVTPETLRTYRRHALVGALILSAIITPPDVFSQVLVALPLLVLYEISIVVSKMTPPK